MKIFTKIYEKIFEQFCNPKFSIDPDKNAVNANYYFRFSFLYILFSFYPPLLCYCPNIVAPSWRLGACYFLFFLFFVSISKAQGLERMN